MIKVAVYIRVSTAEQNFNNQLLDIERYCARQDWEIAEVYSEEESAWKDGHQKELARLLNDQRRGTRNYQRVVVWALDRLSRGGALPMLMLLDSFKRAGCPVVSVREPFMEGPFSDGIYAILGTLAKMESDRNSERTKAGIERKKSLGWIAGRPPGSKDKRPRHRRRKVIYSNR